MTDREGASVEVAVAEVRPARTVVDHARERETDRIVMGGDDTSVLATLLFGRSVASGVDDRTDVPVTVVDDPT